MPADNIAKGELAKQCDGVFTANIKHGICQELERPYMQVVISSNHTPAELSMNTEYFKKRFVAMRVQELLELAGLTFEEIVVARFGKKSSDVYKGEEVWQ